MTDQPSTDLDFLPGGLIERIKPELMPGETLHWAALSDPSKAEPRPKSSRPAWGLAVGSGLVFAVGLIVLFATRSGSMPQVAGSAIAAVMIVALLIGSLALASLLSDALMNRRRSWPRRHARWSYALADRRAIIWSPEGASESLTIRSFPWSLIKAELLQRTQDPDGSGSVLFRGVHDEPRGFVGIQDARKVEWLLRELMGATIDGGTI